MRMSKTAYYADFSIYATVLGVAIPAALLAPGHIARVEWLAAFACGLGGWTLLEYVLHRFAFHRLPFISPLHFAHHAAPRALIGTPTVLSLGTFLLVFFVLPWSLGSLAVAAGLASGVMLGFLWYGILHHAIHHRRPRLVASRLKTASRRHHRHHGTAADGNFGVTTGFWDVVFGTEIPERSAEPLSRAERR